MKLAAAFALALAAAGCSASHIDSIPTWAGGEPQGTPPRLASEMAYPPVHDRPPPLTTKIISVEEQTKIEQELVASRDAQAKRAEQMKKDRDAMLAEKPKLAPPKSPHQEATAD